MRAVDHVLRLSPDGVSVAHCIRADFVVGADIVYGQQDDVLDALYDTITACLSSLPSGETYRGICDHDCQKCKYDANKVRGTQVLIVHKEREGSPTFQQSQRYIYACSCVYHVCAWCVCVCDTCQIYLYMYVYF
jgi:hypothetical protein